MARRDPLKQQLDALAALRDGPRTPDGAAELRRALTGKSSFAAAAAADLIRDSDNELIALLPAAFERFLEDPVRTDKGCAAKTAIARALERLESPHTEVFRRGIRHFQPEPAWGGPQDSAVELRSVCAMALARLSPLDVLDELAELLADPERAARAAAARAIGCTGQPGGGPLLRYKALRGDDDPLVLTESLASLLALDGERALRFVARFLDRDETPREAAALALGQSRLSGAFPLLRELSERLLASERKIPLLALAMLRDPAATDYLLEQVRAAPPAQAAQAIAALGVHRYDAALRKRVTEAAAAQRSAQVSAALEKAFSEGEAGG